MPQYEPEEVKPEPEREPERVIATHLKTTHTDPILHQPSPSLKNLRENLTVPNRYRILVRVRELVGRGARGSKADDLAVLWCRKCSRAIPDTYCKSCEDTGYKHAEVRWQFVLLLEDEVGGELVVVMSGESGLGPPGHSPPIFFFPSCAPSTYSFPARNFQSRNDETIAAEVDRKLTRRPTSIPYPTAPTLPRPRVQLGDRQTARDCHSSPKTKGREYPPRGHV